MEHVTAALMALFLGGLVIGIYPMILRKVRGSVGQKILATIAYGGLASLMCGLGGVILTYLWNASMLNTISAVAALVGMIIVALLLLAAGIYWIWGRLPARWQHAMRSRWARSHERVRH